MSTVRSREARKIDGFCNPTGASERTPRPDRPKALALWLAVIALWWVAFAVGRQLMVRNIDPRYSVRVRSHPSEDPSGAVSPQDVKIRIVCHDIGDA